MNKLLEAKLSHLLQSQQELIKELQTIESAKLNAIPASGKWSVAQIIYHLNKAESLSVIYVSKKMNDIKNLKKTGLYEWSKMVIAKVVLASPVKYKAPVKVLGEVPENVDFNTIIAEWNETMNKLSTLLQSMPEEMLAKNVFKQPAAGRLNIYQMLDFMQAHFNRHRKQIERLIG